jgi:hypothetical protein
MTKFNYRHFVQGLMSATALALALLTEGATPAFAGSASAIGVPGANGACGFPGGAGGAATADAGHLIPNSDASNTATAQGGAGGTGSNLCGSGPNIRTPKAGGPGGAATATTKILAGSAAATAFATGGRGGWGGGPQSDFFGPGRGGAGGAATATSWAWDTGAGAVASNATAHGGNGGGSNGWPFGLIGAGGEATATASGQSTGSGAVDVTASASGGASDVGGGGGAKAYATAVALTGNVQANASTNGGAGSTPGTAFAKSDARNASGEVITMASAPGGGARTSPSASAAAGVGPGTVTLATTFTQGQVVSDALLTPKGSDFSVGAMSAAYGGLGPLQYEATAVFTTSKSETLYLNLLSDNFGQPGFDFDTLTLEVFVNGIEKCSQCAFSSLAGARAFFTAHPIGLGAVAAGESIAMDYFLGYKSGTSAVVGDGFGFTYDLATAPVAKALTTTAFDFAATPTATIPEPSTWAMMLVGFAGLAFARSLRNDIGISADGESRADRRIACASNRMTGMARTPVLPGATPVRALSARRRSS